MQAGVETVLSCPLRILMLSPQYRPIVGGYERAAERLSAALAARGHCVTVIAERRDKAWPAAEFLEGVSVRRLWCAYLPRLHMPTALISLTLFLLTQGRRFDVWHVHQYGLHASLAVALGRLLHRPVVLKLTSSGGQGVARATAAGRFPSLSAALLRRVTAVVALSRETTGEALAFGIPPERIHHLANGVDTAKFRPQSERERYELKQKLGIGLHRAVIYVGRLSHEKNPDGLLHAWSKARPLLTADWKLVFVGDGPMRGELESTVRANGFEADVLFAGQQSRVEQWMGAADIYVSSSHREGLSNTLLEAMASGLPVVATRVSGVTELVKETDAGLVAEVGNMDQLSRALVMLAGDGLLGAKMGAVGRQVISKSYSIESVAARHEALYLSLINASSALRQSNSSRPTEQLKTAAHLPHPFSVLMFVPQYPYPVVGGLEKQSHELARALAAEGFPVQVVSGRTARGQPCSDVVEGVSVTRISWPRRKLCRFFRAPIDVARALWRRRRSYDVIHLHQHSWVGLYVILLAKLLGKPILTKLPNVGDLGLPGLRKQAFGWLRHAILLQSDGIVAMSAQSLAELDYVRYSRERVLLTPNGIALREMSVRMATEDLSVDACQVVFLGRLSEEKQLDVLLDAWAVVCNDGTHEASLAIWGEGPMEHALKQQCVDLGIDTRVKFAGHVGSAASRLAEMDILVLPSRAEGNSNAILEAMAAGLPIVSTPVGGTPMLVGDLGIHFLFRPGDVHTLSVVLLRLIKDRSLRLRTGMAMRRRAEQHFDIQDVARTYATAYGLLAAGKRDLIGKASNPVVLEGS
ncbi:MAG: hypothetical protein DCF27_12130 [Lysobacteraceae bacterium]|nr:MAG: hypothetical protein DCF27_12130 [Xanthomonadaceae bacterium]